MVTSTPPTRWPRVRFPELALESEKLVPFWYANISRAGEQSKSIQQQVQILLPLWRNFFFTAALSAFKSRNLLLLQINHARLFLCLHVDTGGRTVGACGRVS